MVPGIRSDPANAVVTNGSAGHSHCQWPGLNMAIGLQTWPQVVTQNPGICMALGRDTGHEHHHRPSCYSTVDSDRVLRRSPGEMPLWPQRKLKWAPPQLQGSPCDPTWPQVGSQMLDIHMTPDRNRCMNINTDPGCNRASDPDMALGSSPGTDNTIVLGGKQASHISLFSTAFDPSLSMNLSLTLSPSHSPPHICSP